MMCAASLSASRPASRPASCSASPSQLVVPILAEPEPAPPRRRRNRGRKRSKNIDKNNKRLKGAGDMLALRRLTFERVRTLWAARLGTWCAMDFEAWDRDHSLLTEFGWSAARWPAGEKMGSVASMPTKVALRLKGSIRGAGALTSTSSRPGGATPKLSMVV